MKKYVILVALAFLAASCVKHEASEQVQPSQVQNNQSTTTPEQPPTAGNDPYQPVATSTAALADVAKIADGRLQIVSPQENQILGTSFVISGYGQGWFEGTIPFVVRDSNNVFLGGGSFIAPDNDLHPAKFAYVVTLSHLPSSADGTVTFTDSSAKDGSVVYQKIVHVRFQKEIIKVLQTFTDSSKGLSIAYPQTFVAVGPKPSSERNSVNTTACNLNSSQGTRDFFQCFVYDNSGDTATNLSSAALSLSLVPSKNIASECLTFSPAEIAGGKETGTQKINGLLYATAQVSDAATSHYSEAHLYRVFQGGNCYEMASAVYWTNAQVYDPPRKEFDRTAVWASLDFIANSLRFGK